MITMKRINRKVVVVHNGKEYRFKALRDAFAFIFSQR